MKVKNLIQPDRNSMLNANMQAFQGLLQPYAYNILGDSMLAEDVVQEVLNAHFIGSKNHIQNERSYLIRSVINRSINEKKKLQRRQADYLGPWLPTPITTEEGIYKTLDRTKVLHYSLMVLLERLNAKERAVFILKETFDYAHDEIAEVLDIEIEHSRQLLKRARQKLEPEIDQSLTEVKVSESIIGNLTDAILRADMEKVKKLLADEVQSASDGGSSIPAARKVIKGKDNVSKFLQAVYGKYFPPDSETKFTLINHQPAILYLLAGTVYRCVIFEVCKGVIENIFIVVNPDKLKVFSK